MRWLLFVVLCHHLVNLCAVQLLHCAVLLKEKNLLSQGGLWQGLTEFTCVGAGMIFNSFPRTSVWGETSSEKWKDFQSPTQHKSFWYWGSPNKGVYILSLKNMPTEHAQKVSLPTTGQDQSSQSPLFYTYMFSTELLPTRLCSVGDTN